MVIDGGNIILESNKAREYRAFKDLKEEQDGRNRNVKGKKSISCR